VFVVIGETIPAVKRMRASSDRDRSKEPRASSSSSANDVFFHGQVPRAQGAHDFLDKAADI